MTDFSDTKFCESIILPTEDKLKKSLEAAFANAKKSIYLNGKDRVDLCCRSLHKCDAQKHVELNYTIESIRHCKCEQSFKMCLENLNTSLSNNLIFIHSVNATKCYAKDHPIVKCVKIETYPESEAQFFKFMNTNEHEGSFNRCLKYELDKSQPQKIQTFDLPFSSYKLPTIDGSTLLKTIYF